MSLTTEDRQRYQQAVSAFIQGNYEDAETLTSALIKQHPENPNIHLLRGHIFLGTEQYHAAQEEYQIVLTTAQDDEELVNCATNSLADIDQYLGILSSAKQSATPNTTSLDTPAHLSSILHPPVGEDSTAPLFAAPSSSVSIQESLELQPSEPILVNPFAPNPVDNYEQRTHSPAPIIHYASVGTKIEEEKSKEDKLIITKSGSSEYFAENNQNFMDNHLESEFKASLSSAVTAMQDIDEISFPSLDDSSTSKGGDLDQTNEFNPRAFGDQTFENQTFEDQTFEDQTFEDQTFEDQTFEDQTFDTNALDEHTFRNDTFSNDASFEVAPFSALTNENGSEVSSGAELDGRGESSADMPITYPNAESFLHDTEDPTTDLSEWSYSMSESPLPPDDMHTGDLEVLNTAFLQDLEAPNSLTFDDAPAELTSDDQMQFDLSDESDAKHELGVLPSESEVGLFHNKPKAGILAPFMNASLQKKQFIMAAATGTVSALAVVASGQLVGGGKISAAALGMGAASAGVAGGLTTLLLGQVITKQLRNSTNDLQAQLSAVAQGDWGVKATQLSNDEFGQLAKSFNQMTDYIESSTREVQQKAEDQEKAKEDLQRQVIRLLDDVEGAARGDLTVQAEVTADILGAVADSFNLTIYNLQKIVKQVKVAAREVSHGAAENEEFARSLSSDALKQAEELAATLNSVQMMTSSIQEVAESARAADAVAQRASETALRGGEAVESTVTGILQIRETVAETTRKVKRLAESSQEISKIVGFISQIASRTNLLALNASIEAARAGESGRGFAVVADEVRQLADRASKASKEIEQIVLQIQGETSSVMTAMEEGTQQVIEGTQRAEQAKRSLDDIIQVSGQINQLVGSITQATAEQTETSRYVAQVMQSVELTAQETSQESQRVSDSLRNLVGVARDLQTSVERFKVEGTEMN